MRPSDTAVLKLKKNCKQSALYLTLRCSPSLLLHSQRSEVNLRYFMYSITKHTQFIEIISVSTEMCSSMFP